MSTSPPVAALALREAGILIVDDEEANVLLLARLLSRAGFTHVRTTTNPRKALPLFQELAPDLVVLDLRMPELDGFGVLAQLREVTAPSDFLPVLAITGDASPETRRAVIEAGANDFLEKPFDASEVVVRVKNLLTTRLLHRSLQRQNDQLEDKVRERTAELQSALAAAEAGSRAKSQFFATMSHELRTPLNAVIGFANHLKKNKSGTLQAQDLAFVQRIGENGTHLLQIIDDILDLSRVESGKLEVEADAVDVGQVVTDALAHIASAASITTRRVAISASIPPGLRPLSTDESKLRRILINVVGNAAKFTERGSIRVSVLADASGDPVRIDVVDTGIGVSEERLDAIFQVFEQADNSAQRRFGGTGLGLAISRTLCELLGYRLTVVSELHVGSSFSVLLSDGTKPPLSYAEAVANSENLTSVAS